MRRVFVVCAVLMGTSSALAQVNPSASYSFFPKTAKTGEDVAFYGNTSYSLDGAIVEYDWDFGDGTAQTGPIAHHQFAELGNFPVTLTVTDSNGMTATHLQHVAIPLEGPGVIRPGQFEFEDGLEGFVATAGTLSASMEQAYFGTSSLKWDIATEAAGTVEVAIDGTLGIPAGAEVKFRLWVPEGADIDWVQPFVMPHNGDWSFNQWNGAWAGYDSLIKDGWNEFSLTLPSDLPDGLDQRLGVQVDSTAATQLSVYLDSIYWPDTVGADDGPEIDFETDTDGFTSEQGIVTQTTAIAYNGEGSLQFDYDAADAGVVEVKADRDEDIAAGSDILFRVYIPEDASIEWIQPFDFVHNEDYSVQAWHGAWKDYGSIIPGDWNEFVVSLSPGLPQGLIHLMGVQVSLTEASSGTVYVDAIDWPKSAVPPYASFDYDVARPGVGDVVSFAATGNADGRFNSTDGDGTLVSYEWDFGDGATATGATVTHAYAASGQFPVVLTVTDNDGYRHSLTRVLWCDQPEPPFAPPLSVEGTDIVDALGNPITPNGMAIIDTMTWTKADLEYLKKEWKVQAIRLPLIIDRWYYVDDEAREAYLSLVDHYLDWTYELGLYVLFDGWHEGGQGNEIEQWEDIKDGWHILMARYRDREHVLWESFNEPHFTTWEEWAPMAEELVDIIRSYDPVVNAVGVPGVVWAQMLDADTRPIERDQVFYLVHPYPQAYGATWTQERWDQEFGYIVEQGIAPVVNSEYGYPLFDEGDRTGYGEPILKYQEKRGITWLGWIYGGWEGPVPTNPKADLPDDFRLFWEYFNGVWGPTYDVVVEGGVGSGTYDDGDVVQVEWQMPGVPHNKMAIFDGWRGDVEYLEDPMAPVTTLVVPRDDITLWADYHVVRRPRHHRCPTRRIHWGHKDYEQHRRAHRRPAARPRLPGR